MKSKYELIISTKEKLLTDKTVELEDLRNNAEQQVAPYLKREEDEDLFRSKPRRKGKNNTTTTADQLKCQFAECDNEDEDALVKCNACNMWVCEGCHDVPIAKLKQVMNKCQTVYFACKTCNAQRLESSESPDRLGGHRVAPSVGWCFAAL